MRVIFFIESLQAGGKERRAIELIRYLKDTSTDYEIEIVLTEEEIHFEEVLNMGIKINILKRRGLKYDPGLFSRFLTICRRFKPDIIHTWGKMTTFYAIPAKLICRVPIVANLVSDTSERSGRLSFYSFLKNVNTFFSDSVLSNSMAGLKTYRISTPKAIVIYNGVRLARFSRTYDIRQVREDLNIKSRFVVVMVATFSSLKDHDLLLDVACELSTIRKDVTILAVGDGPLFGHIRERIIKESIDNIVLTGRRTDVERLVYASDIGILCTYSEGISNSIIEYMALGKPVIATDIKGGSSELISDGITGYCIERDKIKISNLINFMLDNPDLMYRMGKNGKEKIEKFFSIGRMGKEYEKLYEAITAKHIPHKSLQFHKDAGYQ